MLLIAELCTRPRQRPVLAMAGGYGQFHFSAQGGAASGPVAEHALNCSS